MNQQGLCEGFVPELMVLAVNAPTVTTLFSLVLVHNACVSLTSCVSTSLLIICALLLFFRFQKMLIYNIRCFVFQLISGIPRGF